MADPVWGLLPKSQDDPETIEEAIVRLIAEHETDAGAHTGAGESLETHKAQEILDHPASSIVPDKISSANSFFYIPVNAETDHDADNYSLLYPGFISSMYVNSPIIGAGTDHLRSFNPDAFQYNNGDLILDMLLWASGWSGNWVAWFETSFAIIEIKHGYYRLGYYVAGWVYTDWVAFTEELPNRWRIFYNAGDETLTFLKNGVSVLEIDFIIDFHGEEIPLTMKVDRGTTAGAEIFFGDIKIAFDTTLI